MGAVAPPVDANNARELVEQCRRMLAAIRSGELDAPAETRLRLEGAVAALEALLEQPSSLLATLGAPETPETGS